MCPQGPYSQHFIFFVTYEWADKLECFYLVSLSNLVFCNALAYWAHSKVRIENEGCEYAPSDLIHNTSFSVLTVPYEWIQ